MTVCFTIPGQPVPKARPRVTRSGFAYTPRKTTEFERLVRWCYGGKPEFPGPVRVEIKAYFKIPSGVGKEKARAMEGAYCTKRNGDTDNVAKAVTDALNGVAYKDDSQVCSLMVDKFYSTTPRTVVRILSLGGAD